MNVRTPLETDGSLFLSHETRTLENLAGGNVELTAEEKTEIQALVNEFEVKGDRYAGQDAKALHLWG